jgi:hypothetical protein
MRRALIAIFVLISFPVWAGTFANIQKPCNTACPTSGTTCAVTVTSTGTGHIMVAIAFRDTAGATQTISSVSGAGTWVHPTGANGVDATAGSSDSAYNLSSTSGVTSITLTLSAAVATTWAACVEEYSFTASGVAFDVAGSRDQSTAAANFTGVGLTLAGGNQLIVQYGNDSGTCSGVSAGYGDTVFPNNNCLADALNTSSGTAPTWTSTSGRAALGAIAFKETGGATVSGFDKRQKIEQFER